MSELSSTETPQPVEDSKAGQIESSASPPVAVEPMVTASAAISSPAKSILANVLPITPSGSSTSVTPSEGCGCGGGGPMQLVYALGEIDYDYGSEARLDYFAQTLNPPLIPVVPQELSHRLIS